MNEESIRNRIRILLDEIQSKVDPVILNRCRSIFRQEVSFFHRSYMAAYLLLLSEGSIMEKSIDNSFRGTSRERKNRGLFRGERAKKTNTGFQTEDSRSDSPRILSEEESVQLFVSIGRNRKVFPREILALIISRAKLARDDIGMIRVLDNYSFVQVRTATADTVIEALNGQHFRGRTLTVNFARRGKEEDHNEESSREDRN
ncbi:MAG: DbpA RNA binding domain-containing protein [Treponema sp.]|nr:DbpA RNA binding domain-containing protein [Treponema sp.]